MDARDEGRGSCSERMLVCLEREGKRGRHRKIDRSGDNEQEIKPQRPTTARRIRPCYESLSMAGPARERRFRTEETR